MKFVEVEVWKVPKPFYYHGWLLKSKSEYIVLDDVKFGRMEISRANIVKIRKMKSSEKRLFLSRMAKKEQTIGSALRAIDEYVRKDFIETDKKIIENIRKNVRRLHGRDRKNLRNNTGIRESENIHS
jgi:hypothetical protein